MTYIIVNKSQKIQKDILSNILKRFFDKEITNSPDLHILQPEEKDSIGIEEVKQFQKEMIFKPFQEKVQAGVIWKAEKLTTQAQNALLKTLEETGNYSFYFLCVDNEKNLLSTIRSRGKIIYGKGKDSEEMKISEQTNILQMNLLEQFELIEEIAKEKTSSLDLINDIEEAYRKKLELDIKNGNIDSSKKNLNSLEILQKSRDKIVANCNRRLTLETMILELEA